MGKGKETKKNRGMENRKKVKKKRREKKKIEEGGIGRDGKEMRKEGKL